VIYTASSRRLSIVTFVVFLIVAFAGAATGAPRQAVVLEIDGVIGPAVADYVSRELASVKPDETGVIILRMDTPGGLDTSMRTIIRAILASPVPVAAYVAPSGARAASAGTYITYACAIAAMAPGTNLGAATPIQLQGMPMLPGGEPQSPHRDNGGKAGNSGEAGGTVGNGEVQDTESRKVLNDAVAYIRSLAELNGRNADWAVDAVRSAVSLSADDALRMHVIDVVAADIPDLLHQIDGRSIKVGGRQVVLATGSLTIVPVTPDWRTRLLAVITDPNIAYLLMLVGAYGLIFELMSPGAVMPGVTGTICLLLALFALNLLPIDYAGTGLVLLGIGLMIAEVFIGTFGILGVAGIIAFIAGSVMMFHANAPGFGLSMSVVIAGTVVSAGFILLVLAMLLHSRRRPVITGGEALIGAAGTVLQWDDGAGRVLVNGEVWQAHSRQSMAPGARIKVVARDGLSLTVEPAHLPAA